MTSDALDKNAVDVLEEYGGRISYAAYKACEGIVHLSLYGPDVIDKPYNMIRLKCKKHIIDIQVDFIQEILNSIHGEEMKLIGLVEIER